MNNKLVIKADQTPGIVNFYNYEEFKSTLQEVISIYNINNYTEETIGVAKNDLKELKKIKKILTDAKKTLETSYNEPLVNVTEKLDELIEIVKVPLKAIDDFIKENEKLDKYERILNYANQIAKPLGGYAQKILNSKAFFNPKWLNISYSEKHWKEDIDNIIENAVLDIRSIKSLGGKNESALMARYYETLTLDGAKNFIESVENSLDEEILELDKEDIVKGYKTLKIYGSERQMLQLMTHLDFLGLEYDELEDGMPKPMKEKTNPDFDSFVAFDIEHTGTYGIANGDADPEIIEIGAVKVVNGVVVDKFNELANPGRDIVPRISRLTHITNEMLEDKPPVDYVIKKFKEFVGDNILIGHNITGCDIPHITRAAKKAGFQFENYYLDTRKLAKKFKNKYGWDNIKLTYLSNYFQIEQTEAHRAWCDAETNAYVYLKLKELDELENNQEITIL